jgi:hypothetical protein
MIAIWIIIITYKHQIGRKKQAYLLIKERVSGKMKELSKIQIMPHYREPLGTPK